MDRIELDKKYIFSTELEVRDYELDSEQIVNNSIYLNYMEHTRHKFCNFAGCAFIDLVKEGIIAVVRKVEIEYLSPLKSGDKFFSCLNLERKGARFIFTQDIISTDGELKARAIITIVALENGKLSKGDKLAARFEKFL